MRGATVTLLTDFGTADGYVGEMKGALLTAAPGATLVDIAHDIPPQDVDAARLALSRYWRAFPAGTVHLVVVDPGVGSHRRCIAVEAEGRFLVGPDNGVLSAALDSAGVRIAALEVGAGASATFHGRDVFAPAAARLAAGAALTSLGALVKDPVIRRTAHPRREGNRWIGEVVALDRFGNAITNLRQAGAAIEARGTALRVVRTYADLDRGEAGALRGSSGLFEIVVRDGSAALQLRLERGTPVETSD